MMYLLWGLVPFAIMAAFNGVGLKAFLIWLAAIAVILAIPAAIIVGLVLILV
jgi:hypothetical protein